MCGPAAGAAIAAVLVFTGDLAAFQLAREQAQDEKELREERGKRANANLADKQTNIEARRNRAREVAAQRAFDTNIAVKQAEGAVRVGAGEAGIGGISVDALLNDVSASGLRAQSSIADELTFQNLALDVEQRTAFVNTQNFNAIMSTPIRQPSYYSLLLPGAAAAAQGSQQAGLFNIQDPNQDTTSTANFGSGGAADPNAPFGTPGGRVGGEGVT